MMFMNSLIHLLEVTTLLLVGFLIAQVYRCYLNYNRAQDAQSRVGGAAPAAYSLSVQVNIPSNTALSPYAKSSTPIDTGVMPSAGGAEDIALFVNEPSSIGKAITDIGEPKIEHQDKPAIAQAIATSLPETANDQILNDYIGEFFAETNQPDISAYRQATNVVETRLESKPPVEADSAESLSVESLSAEPLAVSSVLVSKELLDESLTSNNIDELSDSDDIIIVDVEEPLVPVILEEFQGITSDCDESEIPVLTDLSSVCVDELDDDSVITVMAERNDRSSEGKVMSDKVVHAMLDEARLVCAS
jgi:hypothetical protein